MKIIAVDKDNVTLTQVAALAKTGPVILTRGGKPLLAVKDVSHSDWESVSLTNNPRFRALIEESRRSFQEEGGIRLEDLRRELRLPAKRRGRRPGTKKRSLWRERRAPITCVRAPLLTLIMLAAASKE